MERLPMEALEDAINLEKAVIEACEKSEVDAPTNDRVVLKFLQELKEYRCTGLTPEKIIEVDKAFYDRCKEVNRLNAELAEKIIELQDAIEKKDSFWVMVEGLTEELAELKKQLPQFEIGDTAYIVDFEAKVIDESIINGIVRRADKDGVEYEYDSDLLEFHSDDVGVIVFQSHGEAQEALERDETNELP